MDICSAIKNRRLVGFAYDGHSRIVIPTAYGTQSTTGNKVLRGYQIRGTSGSGVPPKWGLFLVDKITDFQILDEAIPFTPPGYSPGDKHISPIHCEL
jgi:hypothetical protein